MTERSAPATWIVPSNLRTFDADAAFAALLEIDWSETTTAGIEVGDRVLLYGTAPIQSLTHECVVVRRGIPFSEVINDTMFWRDRESLASRSDRTWMRLRLIHVFDDHERTKLSLRQLAEYGLTSAPQGRVRASDDVLSHIERVRTRSEADSETSALEVSYFIAAAMRGDYYVPDNRATRSTRGSAQRVFADLVKQNFGHQCAVTGIRTRSVLVASHIVPWAVDPSIRIDPGNGICLSSLVDKAFEEGLLIVREDQSIDIDAERLQGDPVLFAYLSFFRGKKLSPPRHTPLNPEHLRRRIAMHSRRDGAA